MPLSVFPVPTGIVSVRSTKREYAVFAESPMPAVQPDDPFSCLAAKGSGNRQNRFIDRSLMNDYLLD